MRGNRVSVIPKEQLESRFSVFRPFARAPLAPLLLSPLGPSLTSEHGPKKLLPNPLCPSQRPSSDHCPTCAPREPREMVPTTRPTEGLSEGTTAGPGCAPASCSSVNTLGQGPAGSALFSNPVPCLTHPQSPETLGLCMDPYVALWTPPGPSTNHTCVFPQQALLRPSPRKPGVRVSTLCSCDSTRT